VAADVATPHCHVPASFDPEQRAALRRHLNRLEQGDRPDESTGLQAPIRSLLVRAGT